MTLETLFKIANYSVLPFWVLLAVAPRSLWTQRLVHGPVVVLFLAPLYAYLLFGHGSSAEEANMTSLFGVVAAFSVPHVTLAGWIHYLIFDLFVGAWEIRDSQRLGISHWLVLPCLFFTLMLGPIGLLLYVLVRFATKRTVSFTASDT